MKTTLLFLLFPLFIAAQTVEKRPDRNGMKWDNSAAFEAEPCRNFLDWSTWMESWDGKTWATWAMWAGAGVMHGAREAYHADPYVFEKRWGVQETSWWGSDAWKRNYYGNNPDAPHKPEWLGNVGRDVWHTFGAGSKTFVITGSFAIGVRRKVPMKYRVANLVIGWGVQSVMASATYNTLRYRK